MLLNKATLLMALCMILHLSQAKECEESIKRDCKVTVDYQCYFDSERTCFKHYNTNCDMELDACKSNKVFEPWPDKYCDLVQLMCAEEVRIYNWPPEYFFEQIVHIRDNVTNPYEGMY